MSFVTNKWLVGVLVAVMISMGSYIFSNLDRSRDVEYARADANERRITHLEIQTSTIQAEQRAQFAEILRRLERIEVYNSRRWMAP